LKPLPLVLSLHALVKSPSPACFQAPFRYWQAAIRSPRSLLFSRLNSPNSLSLFSQERCCGPPLELPQQVDVCPVLRAPKLDTGLQVVSHRSRTEGQNHRLIGWKRPLRSSSPAIHPTPP